MKIEGDARPSEELPEVDGPAAPVEAPADDARDAEPGDGAGRDAPRRCADRRRLGGQEERGLDTLANDGREREAGETPGGAVPEGPVHRGLQVALHRGGLSPHPEEHPRDDRRRDEERGPLEELFVGLPEFPDRHEEADTQDGAEHDRADRFRARPCRHDGRSPSA